MVPFPSLGDKGKKNQLSKRCGLVKGGQPGMLHNFQNIIQGIISLGEAEKINIDHSSV
jgi:hypothetical protein